MEPCASGGTQVEKVQEVKVDGVKNPYSAEAQAKAREREEAIKGFGASAQQHARAFPNASIADIERLDELDYHSPVNQAKRRADEAKRGADLADLAALKHSGDRV